MKATIPDEWITVDDACQFEIGSSLLGGSVIHIDRDRNLVKVSRGTFIQHQRSINEASPGVRCPCHRCMAADAFLIMPFCSKCGHKRCPRGTDHRLDCTGSNEPGQTGSLYQ